MSSAQLAKRLGVSQPSVTLAEQSEVKGSIELATLRRVAEALDCTLVYALVPNRPLEETVRDRARRFVMQRLAAVEHTMLLEDQKVTTQDPSRDEQERIDSILRDTNPRKFWD